PDEPDSELGYVIPGPAAGADAPAVRTVARFVEKPELPVAARIVRAGGLWNTFIMAASARSLLDMFLPRFAPIVMEMQVILGNALQHRAAGGWPAIVDMYTRLPELDFSRDLLEGGEGALQVLPVPSCGRSEEHTSELQSRENLVCRLLLEKKNLMVLTYLCANHVAQYA